MDWPLIDSIIGKCRIQGRLGKKGKISMKNSDLLLKVAKIIDKRKRTGGFVCEELSDQLFEINLHRISFDGAACITGFDVFKPERLAKEGGYWPIRDDAQTEADVKNQRVLALLFAREMALNGDLTETLFDAEQLEEED